MSEPYVLHRFGSTERQRWVVLRHDLNAMLADWARLRSAMARSPAANFERDEWAYLMTFVAPSALLALFEDEFGKLDVERAEGSQRGPEFGPSTRILRPRNPWAVWLPSNVSLLAPLLVATASLTGATAHFKVGSDADDLAGSFLAWALENAGEGPLRSWLSRQVRIERFDRADARNQQFAKTARLRIAFGSDESIAAIESLPHPVDSPFIAFGDRVSQAFIDLPLAGEESTVDVLIRTFAIYGSAGCTSPRRIVLLDATHEQARDLRDRLLQRWSKIVRRDVSMAAASQNVATMQLARAAGWDACLAPRSSAVVSIGHPELANVPGTGHLEIVTASVEEAIAQLPANVQTVGLACTPALATQLAARLATTPVQRIVALARMHHFGNVWDGVPLVASLFEHVAVAL